VYLFSFTEFCAVLLIADENGAYYWHIKSGTIQREAPIASPVDVHSTNDATSFSSVSVKVFVLVFASSLHSGTLFFSVLMLLIG